MDARATGPRKLQIDQSNPSYSAVDGAMGMRIEFVGMRDAKTLRIWMAMMGESDGRKKNGKRLMDWEDEEKRGAKKII